MANCISTLVSSAARDARIYRLYTLYRLCSNCVRWSSKRAEHKHGSSLESVTKRFSISRCEVCYAFRLQCCNSPFPRLQHCNSPTATLQQPPHYAIESAPSPPIATLQLTSKNGMQPYCNVANASKLGTIATRARRKALQCIATR